GRTLLAAIDGKVVRLWHDRLGPKFIPLEGHTDLVKCVAFAPDGKTLVSGTSKVEDNGEGVGGVRVWDAAAGGARLRPLRGRGGGVKCVAFAGDGKRLAAGSFHGRVTVWEVTAKGEMRPFGPGIVVVRKPGAKEPVGSVALSPDGKVLATGDAAGVRLWD